VININENKGFQITFSNGWTVSVQLEREYDRGGSFYSKEEGEATAEIAAFKGEGLGKPWHSFSEGDTVKRWCQPDEILDFMNMVSKK
tara:strand:- start:55 stop:315 length:261 start_codon:yes stop_codon:yes gene_type:complete